MQDKSWFHTALTTILSNLGWWFRIVDIENGWTVVIQPTGYKRNDGAVYQIGIVGRGNGWIITTRGFQSGVITDRATALDLLCQVVTYGEVHSYTGETYDGTRRYTAGRDQ